MYYIYHIPERHKIGVSRNLKARMKQHKWTGAYEIMEIHTCIYKVSDREIELQKEYRARFGKYKVDTTPYWKTIERSRNGGLNTAKGQHSEMGKKSKPSAHQIQNILDYAKTKRGMNYEQAQYIRAQYKKGTDIFGNRITLHRLGKVFNVSHVAITNIIHNKTYTTP